MQPLTHQPTVSLTPQQIDDFHRDGFLSLPSISNLQEIELMKDAYDRIFSEQAGRERGDQFDLAGDDADEKTQNLPQILGPEKYAPELWDTLARANALHIVRQLFGDDMEPQGSHAIFKPAKHGATTPWHQDEAYWSANLEYRSVSVWMPLQDVDEENGCMQFIAGSHLREVAPHQPINNNPKVHGLELAPEASENLSNPRICPLPAGGATFHPSRTLHFTAANHSDRPRRALIMMFGAPAKPREELGLSPRIFEWQQRQNTNRAERAKASAK
jgi:ectoine hydroxylase-related dioxygenase (phytanoyl-CoA dioxygenase family)